MSGVQNKETGTTILALKYQDGVILGADGRVTVGNYIENRASAKLQKLTENVIMARSGSCKDAEYVGDYVTKILQSYELERGEDVTVQQAATIVQKLNYYNKDAFTNALIISGYDVYKKGQVYNTSLGGPIVGMEWHIDGSGSSYATGYLDEVYRQNMDLKQAIEVAINSLALAMSTDSSSGGSIRLAIVTQHGSKEIYIPHDKVPYYNLEVAHNINKTQSQNLPLDHSNNTLLKETLQMLQVNN